MPNEDVYGNGGLLTTAEDLLKWNAWYLSGHLANPSLLSKQLAVDTFRNGQPNEYGAGLSVSPVIKARSSSFPKKNKCPFRSVVRKE
jgi:hypothetical protein